MMSNQTLLFFERFSADILSGKKTITLRDESESHYLPGQDVELVALETKRAFGQARILGVSEIKKASLNQWHARQENMTLDALHQVIEEIYPGLEDLFLIEFTLR